MNIKEYEAKISRIEKDSLKAFEQNNPNEARQAAEAIAKLILMSCTDQSKAEQAINKDLNAMKILIDQEKLASNDGNNRKKVYQYFSVLQTFGNIASHSNPDLETKEIEFPLLALSNFLKWLYSDYLGGKTIPKELHEAMIGYEKATNLEQTPHRNIQQGDKSVYIEKNEGNITIS